MRVAGCRERRKKQVAVCGLPHTPATELAAHADAGRAAANRPACMYTSSAAQAAAACSPRADFPAAAANVRASAAVARRPNSSHDEPPRQWDGDLS